MHTPETIAIAGTVAAVLRQSISAIEARRDWSADQRRRIPWILVALSALVAGAAYLAGESGATSTILAGGPVGAMVVHALAGTRTPAPAPVVEDAPPVQP